MEEAHFDRSFLLPCDCDCDCSFDYSDLPARYNGGCAFPRDKCLSGPEPTPLDDDLFCTTSGSRGCVVDHSAFGNCQVFNYGSLPAHFSYFPGEPTKGGPQADDFCPIFSAFTFTGTDGEDSSCANLANRGSRTGTPVVDRSLRTTPEHVNAAAACHTAEILRKYVDKILLIVAHSAPRGPTMVTG